MAFPGTQGDNALQVLHIRTPTYVGNDRNIIPQAMLFHGKSIILAKR